MKCLSRDINGEPCRCNVATDTRFCKLHQYMNEYTDEMLGRLELCSGCKKMYCFNEGRKICENCADRSKTNRLAAKSTIELCGKDQCKYKRSSENKYCKLHQLQLFVDETVSEGKKVCKGYIRGCRVKLDETYTFSKCQECLENDREKENNRRNRAKATEIDASTEKLCTTCCKVLPLGRFVGLRSETTITCDMCRESNKIQDAKRDKEHRNALARINDTKPERLAVKQQWKNDNYEKVAEYCMNSRQNRIEKLGVDEYLKHNAENAKNWRKNNQEKVQQINQDKINSVKLQYGIYKRSAEMKQLQFEIDLMTFEIIIRDPCEYCGIIQDRGFNGIDRINSTIGYTDSNSVSCCTMCNYMKNTLSSSVFIHRTEHILTYNGIIEGSLFPDLFGDYISVSFTRYKNRAKEKGLEFEITQEEFNNLIKYDCYLCGKSNSTTHVNGIDRFANSIGYTIDNSRTCCADCNYMKRDFSYDDVLSKMKLIYERHKNATFNDNNENRPMLPSNKKTSEQIKMESELKKKQRRLELEAKYKDKEYKKSRAKQIADNRKEHL